MNVFWCGCVSSGITHPAARGAGPWFAAPAPVTDVPHALSAPPMAARIAVRSV
ncbi:hypothetical protein ACIBEJ_23505 [Nonomuraea sp. NPDC050790]|uniref:hypothetical protein n=1 Tax=Nonomuraea sp. NPDC050790 TaxID=3364371 RepID=UPI0037A0700A